MPKLTQEQLDTLTEDEIEALNDDSFVDEGSGEADEEIVAAAIPDDDEPAKDAPAIVPAADDPAVTEPAAASTAEPASADTTPAPEPAEEQPVPAPARSAARDFDAELRAIAEKQDALAAQADAGDITLADFTRQNRELSNQLQDVRADQRDFTKMQADARAHWAQVDVPTFLAAHPAYAPGSLRYKTLDALVREYQTELLDSGAPESAQFDPQFLQRAHEKIERELGATAAPSALPKPPAKRELPPNLATVPAAGNDDDVTRSGTWDMLDRLADTNPEEYEKRLGQLSDTERDAYLRT